eukprot:15130985-Alexandrium_andersonii.AAC.1
MQPKRSSNADGPTDLGVQSREVELGPPVVEGSRAAPGHEHREARLLLDDAPQRSPDVPGLPGQARVAEG